MERPRAAEFLYGRRPVLEALRAGRRAIKRVLIARGAHGRPLDEIRAAAAERNVPVEEVPRERIEAIHPESQGVLADVSDYRYAQFAGLLATPPRPGELPLLVALDSLHDPQNFGALLRTALAVGARGAIIPEHRSVAVTPAVSKASAGAVEHLAVARVTNLPRALDELRAAGYWTVGLDPEGEQPYDRADLGRPLVVVVGAEGRGLGPLVKAHCDLTVRLPMQGPVTSLNAAVAGSIVLYEARRQQTAALAGPAVEPVEAGRPAPRAAGR